MRRHLNGTLKLGRHLKRHLTTYKSEPTPTASIPSIEDSAAIEYSTAVVPKLESEDVKPQWIKRAADVSSSRPRRVKTKAVSRAADVAGSRPCSKPKTVSQSSKPVPTKQAAVPVSAVLTSREERRVNLGAFSASAPPLRPPWWCTHCNVDFKKRKAYRKHRKEAGLSSTHGGSRKRKHKTSRKRRRRT
jgi:hypothetical protein